MTTWEKMDNGYWHRKHGEIRRKGPRGPWEVYSYAFPDENFPWYKSLSAAKRDLLYCTRVARYFKGLRRSVYAHTAIAAFPDLRWRRHEITLVPYIETWAHNVMRSFAVTERVFWVSSEKSHKISWYWSGCDEERRDAIKSAALLEDYETVRGLLGL